MQSSGIGKHVLGALALAIAIYAAGFTLDQHLRTRRGPWQVTFTTEPTGNPAIVINHPKLRVANLKIIFAGETTTNSPATVAFDRPRKSASFGEVKFEDLTYLPGTVTLGLFGHEIELLPRTLYVNRKAHPWKSEETITLSAGDKPPFLSEPRRTRKRY